MENVKEGLKTLKLLKGIKDFKSATDLGLKKLQRNLLMKY